MLYPTRCFLNYLKYSKEPSLSTTSPRLSWRKNYLLELLELLELARQFIFENISSHWLWCGERGRNVVLQVGQHNDFKLKEIHLVTFANKLKTRLLPKANRSNNVKYRSGRKAHPTQPHDQQNIKNTFLLLNSLMKFFPNNLTRATRFSFQQISSLQYHPINEEFSEQRAPTGFLGR